jgi:hypothetical protein
MGLAEKLAEKGQALWFVVPAATSQSGFVRIAKSPLLLKVFFPGWKCSPAPAHCRLAYPAGLATHHRHAN